MINIFLPSNFFKASIYYSAILYRADASPSGDCNASFKKSILWTVAIAFRSISYAYPYALSTLERLTASASFISDYIRPSEVRISALFYRSASASKNITFFIVSLTWMSFISYLRHFIPQVSTAYDSSASIRPFILSLSSNV